MRRSDFDAPRATLGELPEYEALPEIRGLGTGVACFDRFLDSHQGEPLLPGQVCVIAARPGLGKTAFVTGAAVHNWRQGRRVAFFTIEQDLGAMWARVLRCIIGRKLKWRSTGWAPIARHRRAAARPMLSAAQLDDLAAAYDQTRNDTGFLLDPVRERITDWRGYLRRRCEEHHPDLVVVDFMQLAKRFYPGGDPDWAKIARAVEDTIDVAKEHGFSALVTSQFSRGGRNDGGNAAGSEAVNQLASIFVSIGHQRDDILVDRPTGVEDAWNAWGHASKNRGGRCGVFELSWDGPSMTYFDPSESIYLDAQSSIGEWM